MIFANHPQIHAAVDILTRLLEMLYPNQANLDIVTVADIQRRYPLTGLGAPAMRAIEQAQRIVRATNAYQLIGLCEYHIGLIYLHFGDSRGASQQFAAARRQWSFVNATAAVCLSLFAEGRAQELALHHESAMTCYSKAEQRLPRIRFDPVKDNFRRFTSTLAHELAQSKESLRQLLQQAWPDQESAPPNHVAPEHVPITPIPTIMPIPVNTNSRWFRVERQRDTFLSHIPDGALVHVNSTPSSYDRDELVAVGFRDEPTTQGHILLIPFMHELSFVAVYLAQWTGPFVRRQEVSAVDFELDVGNGHEKLPATILGQITGHWVAQ
ncbi:MAG: hypothetical protein KC415_03560 [Anaerolineales bacterium]|nr:hypothetical protein [Anaerolineales bacterium]